MRHRTGLALSLVTLLTFSAGARQAVRPAANDLPPVVYVCPMPGDEAVLELKPGSCPNCKMTLVPIRLDSKWWCPTHQTLMVRDDPGKCPLDHKDLVPVTLSEFWTCPDKPDTKLLEPGACPGGAARKIGYELRAHGDHNPKHGGQFFMASDQWHHIEGTYPRAGLFRLYFYDNFTKPMAIKGFSGSLVVLDKAGTEIASYPLVPSRDGKTLEAQIPAANGALPLNAAAKMKFTVATTEQRFDFPFTAFSKEPAPAVATTAAQTAPLPKQKTAISTGPPAKSEVAAATPSVTPAPAADQNDPIAPMNALAPAFSPALSEATDESKLPSGLPALLAELTSRTAEIESLLNDGNISGAWLPAMGTKTAALVLDSHSSTLPEGPRAVAMVAVKQIVAAAWDIDQFGELGNKQKTVEAFKRLTSAVTELKTAYASQR